MIDLNKYNDPDRTIREEDRITAASVGVYPEALKAIRQKRAQEAYDAAMEETDSLPPVVAAGQGRDDWSDEEAAAIARGVSVSLLIMTGVAAVIWAYLYFT